MIPYRYPAKNRWRTAVSETRRKWSFRTSSRLHWGRLPKCLRHYIDPPRWGHVAEWLRNGLQNRVLRFNSGRGLQSFQILRWIFKDAQAGVFASGTHQEPRSTSRRGPCARGPHRRQGLLFDAAPAPRRDRGTFFFGVRVIGVNSHSSRQYQRSLPVESILLKALPRYSAALINRMASFGVIPLHSAIAT